MSLRYVILHHTGWLEDHFDLMFELSPDSPLKTWRSSVWPIVDAVSVAPLPDHRAIYLDYQGPVSNNRGQVTRVQAGTHILASTPAEFIHALDNETVLIFRLSKETNLWTASIK